MIPFNPHIRYFEGDRKGYVRTRVTKRRLEADVRFVSRVGSPGATIATDASFAGDHGDPAIRRTG
jgi:alkaline phosphatase D